MFDNSWSLNDPFNQFKIRSLTFRFFSFQAWFNLTENLIKQMRVVDKATNTSIDNYGYIHLFFDEFLFLFAIVECPTERDATVKVKTFRSLLQTQEWKSFLSPEAYVLHPAVSSHSLIQQMM